MNANLPDAAAPAALPPAALDTFAADPVPGGQLAERLVSIAAMAVVFVSGAAAVLV